MKNETYASAEGASEKNCKILAKNYERLPRIASTCAKQEVSSKSSKTMPSRVRYFARAFQYNANKIRERRRCERENYKALAKLNAMLLKIVATCTKQLLVLKSSKICRSRMRYRARASQHKTREMREREKVQGFSEIYADLLIIALAWTKQKVFSKSSKVMLSRTRYFRPPPRTIQDEREKFAGF